jgi:hypothetical protein
MALGKRRRERHLEAFVVASDLPKSPGHPTIVADKGYYSTKVVTLPADLRRRAYISERASPEQRRWTD